MNMSHHDLVFFSVFSFALGAGMGFYVAIIA